MVNVLLSFNALVLQGEDVLSEDNEEILFQDLF